MRRHSPPQQKRPECLQILAFNWMEGPMKRIAFLLVAVATVVGVVGSIGPVSGQADEEAAPIFGITIPPGYRHWRLISVAHEEGNLNDFRAILGNDVAGKPFGKGSFHSRTAQSLPGW